MARDWSAEVAESRAREEADFEGRCEVLRQGFDMRMLEARQKAVFLRDNYLSEVVRCKARALLAEARAERCIERAEKIDKILEANRDRNLIRARHGATPETLAKPRFRDPITMLVEKGKLDTGQERAAVEIATIYQAVVAALMPRIANLNGSGKGPGRGSSEDRMSEEIAVLHHDRYIPWARALAKKDDISLPLVIDVAVDGQSVNTACRHRRVGYARGVKLIAAALTLYVYGVAVEAPRGREAVR